MAQLASAPALGAGGPPFESEYPDTKEESEIVLWSCFFCVYSRKIVLPTTSDCNDGTLSAYKADAGFAYEAGLVSARKNSVSLLR